MVGLWGKPKARGHLSVSQDELQLGMPSLSLIHFLLLSGTSQDPHFESQVSEHLVSKVEV